MREADAKSKVPLIGVYLCNWAAIFALLFFAVYAWNALNLRKQPSIKGTIADLERDENVFFDSNQEMYLRRSDNSGDGSFRYDYLCYLHSSASPIPFVFSRGRNKKVTRHEIPVRQEFRAIKRSSTSTMRETPTSCSWSSSTKARASRWSCHRLARRELPSHLPSSAGSLIVHAQNTFSAQTMSRRLESENPTIRRAAQDDLAKQGSRRPALHQQGSARADQQLQLAVRGDRRAQSDDERQLRLS